MSRLQTGSVVITQKPIGIEEIVATAIVGLHIPPERIRVDVPETLPLCQRRPHLARARQWRISSTMPCRSHPRACPFDVEAAAIGDELHLRVVDAGPGIRVEDRERLSSEPFQRLGDHPNGSGVGLGLAVARGFVNAVGGELVIEDTPGGGCTMVVTIPIEAP